MAVRWAGDPRVSWSVQVTDPRTDEVLLAVTPDVVLPTASVAKVLLLSEVAARVEAGLLSLDQPLDRRVTPPVGDSGLWQHLEADVLPLNDVAVLVASVSDNWATNVLVETVGLASSGLLDLVRDQRGPAHPPVLSLGNASGWTTYLGRLHRGEVPGSERVLAWLATGVDHSLVASAFGLDPLVVDPRLVNKTGSDEGVRADVGLVTGPTRTLAYAAIASWQGDLLPVVLRDLRRLGEQLRAALDDVG